MDFRHGGLRDGYGAGGIGKMSWERDVDGGGRVGRWGFGMLMGWVREERRGRAATALIMALAFHNQHSRGMKGY